MATQKCPYCGEEYDPTFMVRPHKCKEMQIHEKEQQMKRLKKEIENLKEEGLQSSDNASGGRGTFQVETSNEVSLKQKSYERKSSQPNQSLSYSMKWFDTQEIKNKENLTPEQIEYIKKPSLTIFGPFNIIVRKHWDFLVAWLILSFFARMAAYIGCPGWLTLALFIGEIYLVYFMIVHGRRLAWNRNNFKSFEEFQRSEAVWTPWGIVFLILYILATLGPFFLVSLEGS